jgi:hypothetical protein
MALGVPGVSVEVPLFLRRSFADGYAEVALVFRKVLGKLALHIYPHELQCDQRLLDIARPDLLPHGDSHSILEQNISAGVSGYNELRSWENYFVGHPVIGEYVKGAYPSDELFNHYAQWIIRNFGKNTHVGVLDLVENRGIDSPNGTALIMVQQLRKRGISALWCSEYELELRPNGVYIAGARIDAIWSHLNPHDFLYGPDHLQNLAKVAKTGAVHLLNGPGATLVLDKGLMAHVFELETRTLIDDSDFKVLQEHLPWTMLVNESEIEYEGMTQLKRVLLKENKDLFVLKRSDSYAAMHVELGPEHDRDSWESLIDVAIKEKNWIAQSYVYSEPIMLPFLRDGAIIELPSQVLCSPYFVDENCVGFFGFSRRFSQRQGMRNISFSTFPVYVVD